MNQVGVFLIAGAALGLEVALTRVLSLSLWYHFSFLIVSVALLGTGFSGVALAALRIRTSEGARRMQVFGCVAFGLTAWFGFLAAQGLDVHPESLSVREGDPLWRTIFRAAFEDQAPMLAVYLLYLLPFLSAGLALGATFASASGKIGRLYAADLTGAAAGALGALLALRPFGAPAIIAGVAALAGLAGAIFAFGSSRRGAAWLAVASAAALVVSPHAGEVVTIHVSAEKRHPKNEPTIASAWSELGYSVAVDEKTKGRVGIYVDYVCYTPIERARPPFVGLDWMIHDRLAPLLVSEHPRVLVIGSGGGRDVLAALAHGAEGVDAVEVNPTIVDWVRGRFADFSGRLFFDPRVRLFRAEGRSFLRHSDRVYDVIVMQNALTQTAAAAGAFNLAEDYLMTTDAFGEYLGHLRDGGFLYVRRPYPEVKRLAVVSRAAWESLRPSPGMYPDCVAVGEMGGPYRTTFVMLKKGPINSAETTKLRAYLKSEKGYPLYLPGAKPGHFRNTVAQLVTTADPAPLIAAAETDLSAPTDDRPFFSQRAKLDHLASPELAEVRGFFPQSALLLVVTLVQSATVALLFLGVPALLLPTGGLRPISGRVAWLLYFSLLGLAFAGVELGLLQRMTLLVGDPTRTFAVVLVSLLLGSGIGSLASSVLPARSWALAIPGVLLITGLVYLQFQWPEIAQATLSFPEDRRIELGAGICAALGIPMGMFFPSGIRLLGARAPAAIPWAWAANGFFSVVGAASAVCGGIFGGFSLVAWCSIAVYVAATCLIAAIGRPAESRRLGNKPAI